MIKFLEVYAHKHKQVPTTPPENWPIDGTGFFTRPKRVVETVMKLF